MAPHDGNVRPVTDGRMTLARLEYQARTELADVDNGKLKWVVCGIDSFSLFF